MHYDLLVQNWWLQDVVNLRMDSTMYNEQFQEIVEMLWRYETPIYSIQLQVWENIQTGDDDEWYSDEIIDHLVKTWIISKPVDLYNLVEEIRSTANFIDKLL